MAQGAIAKVGWHGGGVGIEEFNNSATSLYVGSQ